MSSNTLQAHHIVWEPSTRLFYAVYPIGTTRAQVARVAAQLQRFGIESKAAVVWLPQSPQPAPVLSVAPQRIPPASRALEVFKQQVRPELPIVINSFDVDMQVCICGDLCLRLPKIDFVIGFAPVDLRAFGEAYDDIVRSLRLKSLVQVSPQRPYIGVVSALRRTLEMIGAHATTVQVTKLSLPRILPCEH